MWPLHCPFGRIGSQMPTQLNWQNNFRLPVNLPESGLANPGHECYRLFATVIFPPRSTRAETGI